MATNPPAATPSRVGAGPSASMFPVVAIIEVAWLLFLAWIATR
jgi:hypothetical protein